MLQSNVAEEESTEGVLSETIGVKTGILEDATVKGDLTGLLDFSNFELVMIDTGSFANQGFSQGTWDATLEGQPYSGEWQGMAYLSTEGAKINLKGTMIFGTSRVISRKNSEVEGCESLVVDLTEVDHLGVSASLALEEAMLDMLKARRPVYLVGAVGQSRERLERLGILQRLRKDRVLDSREAALSLAVKEHLARAGRPVVAEA